MEINEIFGRTDEIRQLKDVYNSRRSEFLVVYGRKGVGKTHLISNHFKDKFFLHATTLPELSKKQQIKNILSELNQASLPIKDWQEIFFLFETLLSQTTDNNKKIIFFDEISLFCKGKSRFLPNFSTFWNSISSKRDDILLILSSSAIPWITDNIFNNIGGLYNRVTKRIHLNPFTLKETGEYLDHYFPNYSLNRMDVLDLYMVFGGIPYYYSKLNVSLPIQQNIDTMFFKTDSCYKNDFQDLFHFMFDDPDSHIRVLKTISNELKGLTRNEIINSSNIESSEYLTQILENLEISGLIRRYYIFQNYENETIYQLLDHLSLFHLRFIENNPSLEEDFWVNNNASPSVLLWKNYSYEIVCINHSSLIKKSLGISGIPTNMCSWRNSNLQIELLILRGDETVNLFEFQYSSSPYELTKDFSQNVMNKISQFLEDQLSYTTVYPVLVTTMGVASSKYKSDLLSILTLDDLFS